ncbi:MAG: hypothetical protein ACO1QB_08445 [Verrucomicrobiales bacterium]
MNANNRQKMLMIVAMVGGAIFVGDRLVLSPLISSWKERSKAIAELQQSVTKGTQLLEREQVLSERWSQMRTNTLPENLSAAENLVFKAFDRWSSESNISIASIKPEWKQAGEDYVTLECRADGFGSIDAIAKFLYQLERDQLALRVDLVEITARDNNGQQLAIGVQVSGLQLAAPEL